ncbi:hypothetical protein D9M73_119990 [compost metagenome]
MVVKAAALVIIDDEHRFGKDLGMVDQGGDQLGAKMFAARGHGGRMFGQVGGGDDPRHLRQGPRRQIAPEALDQLLPVRAGAVGTGLMFAHPRSTAPVQSGIARARAEGGKDRQRVVAEIVIFLIDLPAYPRLFQPLGISGPAIGIGA